MEDTCIRARRESGQMLVLFVLALGVLMGFAAMSIDVGMILHERRSAQNAADAAALAAVQELPDSTSAAVAAAAKWAKNNGYGPSSGATVTVNTPYQGDPTRVEVIIEETTPFLFARAVGLDSVGVKARAVAKRKDSYLPVIFANSTGCKYPQEVSITGSDLEFTGGIQSNGEVKISSSNVAVNEGDITYLCDPPHISGSNVAVIDGEQTAVSQTSDWPVMYDFSDFSCDFTSVGDMLIDRNSPQYWMGEDPDTNTLKPGTYCSEAGITVGKEAYGNVTFAAKGQIVIGTDVVDEANRFNFTAWEHDVVAFSAYVTPYGGNEEEVSAIHVSADTFEWQGFLLAPQGRVKLSTSSVHSDSGSIFADTVVIATSAGSVTAVEDESSGRPRLVE